MNHTIPNGQHGWDVVAEERFCNLNPPLRHTYYNYMPSTSVSIDIYLTTTL